MVGVEPTHRLLEKAKSEGALKVGDLDATARQPIDLKAARDSGSIDVEEFGTIVEDGVAGLNRHKTYLRLISDNPLFDKSRLIHYSRQEIIVQNDFDKADLLRLAAYTDEVNPLYLHLGMFTTALRTQMDEEQYERWREDVSKFRVLGCGLANLETTATLDLKTDEWIINSPTLSSAKFWPGGLAKFSNHAIVYAQLVIDDKSYGPHGFVVQTRAFEDHREMRGVTLKDIGPKVGYAGMDNGYAMFDHVRIPRRNMLMRFAKVTRDGQYSKPPHPKLGYTVMTESRVMIVGLAWRYLARALVIGIRYCLVRRQGLRRGVEPQVIDYPMVQHRLISQLSKAFALNASYVWLCSLYTKMMDGQYFNQEFGLLPEVHAMSSALKSYGTDAAIYGIEEARRCLGGHGYLKVSGIPQFFNNFVGALTFEGENGLLTQQTARYLLKQADNPTGHSTRYLIHSSHPYTWSAGEGLPSLQDMLTLFGFRVLHQLKVLQAQVQSQPWDALNLECARISLAQAEYTCLMAMMERADALSKTGISEASLTVYRWLALTYALSCVDKASGDFLETSSITPAQISMLRQALLQAYRQLRPELALLADSFHLSDAYLASALGSSDGRVYERLVDSVMQNPFNHVVEGEAVLGYNKYIRPLVHGHILVNNPNKGLPSSKL
ncbi:hypothetical protein L0F63_003960 [Massospora cicadina]|nr:hypothetical protein L0F63_003960 [Massospora cicadina]